MRSKVILPLLAAVFLFSLTLPAFALQVPASGALVRSQAFVWIDDIRGSGEYTFQGKGDDCSSTGTAGWDWHRWRCQVKEGGGAWGPGLGIQYRYVYSEYGIVVECWIADDYYGDNSGFLNVMIAGELSIIQPPFDITLPPPNVPDSNTDSNTPSQVSEPAQSKEPVYLRTGEYYYNATDLTVKERALTVSIERQYRSKSEYNSAFGYGWDMNYNKKVRRLKGDTSKVVLLDGQNGRIEYDKVGSSSIYKNPQYIGEYFYDNGNTLTLFKKDRTKLNFDENGNLSAITDRNGNSITFHYDPQGLMPIYGPSMYFGDTSIGLVGKAYRITSITDDLERDIHLSYNTKGLLESITDFTGRRWTYGYDAYNNLTTVTGPNTVGYPQGLTTTYLYEDGTNVHNLTSIQDPNGQTWLSNTYSDNKVVSQIWGEGTVHFTYNTGNNTATMSQRQQVNNKDVNNVVVYNNAGSVVSDRTYTTGARVTDPAFYETRYEYYSTGLKKNKILSGNNFIHYEYDANGNVLAISMEPNQVGKVNIPIEFTYDANWDSVRTITDPCGSIITIDYNNIYGDIDKITYPEVNVVDKTGVVVKAQPSVTYTYNEYGQVKTATSPAGIVTLYEYYTGCDAGTDPNCGRLWKVTVDYNTIDGCNITYELKYDDYGHIRQVIDPCNNTTSYLYNALNQLERVTDPCNRVTDMWYNNCKKLSMAQRPIGDTNQVVSYAYDILDHVKAVTDPLGYVTKLKYDKNDNRSDVTDAEENNTHYEYDERNLLWKVTDANGGVTECNYTPNGNLNCIVDAKNNETCFEYDPYDRLTAIVYPDNSAEVFDYDRRSNITSYTNRNGQTTLYKYDALSRVIEKIRLGEPSIIFRYDIAGRLVDVNDKRQVADGGGMTRFKYDRIGQVIEVNDIYGRIVKYEYDVMGRRAKLDYPDTTDDVSYKYDCLSRVKTISCGTTQAAGYQYDHLGRRESVSYGNDTSITYEYDIANRLTGLANNLNGSTITYDYTNYDKVDNRLSCSIDGQDAQVYSYDKLYQLIYAEYNDVDKASYDYDKLGNRTQMTKNTADTFYNSNALNQYVHVAGVAYTYDANGNLTYDGTHTYAYDYENRLLTVDGGSTASYKYDFAGRRVSKTAGGVTTTYLYDGGSVIAEYQGTTCVRRYVVGPGIDKPISMTAGADIYYYHFDGVGSVVALSNVSGQVAERYNYNVFGEPNYTSGVGNRFMFTGREYDSETGNYYYRARYYSPKIGRFLQTDPIRYRGGANFYRYCRNNPMRWRDPFGLGIVPISPEPDVGAPPTLAPSPIFPVPAGPVTFPPTNLPSNPSSSPSVFGPPSDFPVLSPLESSGGPYDETADSRRFNPWLWNPVYFPVLPYDHEMDPIERIECYTDTLVSPEFWELEGECLMRLPEVIIDDVTNHVIGVFIYIIYPEERMPIPGLKECPKQPPS